MAPVDRRSFSFGALGSGPDRTRMPPLSAPPTTSQSLPLWTMESLPGCPLMSRDPALPSPPPRIVTFNSYLPVPALWKNGLRPHNSTWRPWTLDACVLKKGSLARFELRLAGLFTARSQSPTRSTSACGLEVILNSSVSGITSSCSSPFWKNLTSSGSAAPGGTSMWCSFSFVVHSPRICTFLVRRKHLAPPLTNFSRRHWIGISTVLPGPFVFSSTSFIFSARTS
mmetsp:Transcript_54766/g.154156  ORF Transcript_54766/g.154156 Transcript_54766/m.154156 type:complete len:226 (+) Transcript_54766:2517-3194(+)